ncbi:hypothetical protein Csa_016826, partial [Cucumis sativus]
MQKPREEEVLMRVYYSVENDLILERLERIEKNQVINEMLNENQRVLTRTQTLLKEQMELLMEKTNLLVNKMENIEWNVKEQVNDQQFM